MEKAVIDYSNKTTYDLDNPFLCNGSITHRIFISPSITNDRTLKRDGKILIDGSENQNIIDMCKVIKDMAEHINQVLEL